MTVRTESRQYRPVRTPVRLRLGEWAFGVTPASAASARGAIVTVAMLLLGTIIVFLRLAENARKLVWAEDGAVFLTAAYRGDFWSTVLVPYAGYMHLFPRMAAELASTFVAPENLGYGMNLAGSFAWSAAAAAGFAFSRGRLILPLRVLLWAGVLILPIGSLEVATNVCNSHWFLIYAAFWALAGRPRGIVKAAFASVLVVVAVLSDPLALALLPLAAGRLILLPSWREKAVGVAYIAALALQLIVVSSTTRPTSDEAPEPLTLGAMYLARIIWAGLFGISGSKISLGEIGLIPILVGAGLILVVLVTLILARVRRTGLPAIALILSLGFFAVVHVLTWAGTGGFPSGQEFTLGGRYLVVPILLWWVAVFGTVDAWLPTAAGRRRRMATAVVVALAAVCVVLPGLADYSNPIEKSGFANFESGVAGAERVCDTGRRDSAEIETAPRGYALIIPCDEFR